MILVSKIIINSNLLFISPHIIELLFDFKTAIEDSYRKQVQIDEDICIVDVVDTVSFSPCTTKKYLFN